MVAGQPALRTHTLEAAEHNRVPPAAIRIQEADADMGTVGTILSAISAGMAIVGGSCWFCFFSSAERDNWGRAEAAREASAICARSTRAKTGSPNGTPPGDPPVVRCAAFSEFTTFIAHVRYASNGTVSVEHTHPFERMYVDRIGDCPPWSCGPALV
jgi:hypothetical protein